MEIGWAYIYANLFRQRLAKYAGVPMIVDFRTTQKFRVCKSFPGSGMVRIGDEERFQLACANGAMVSRVSDFWLVNLGKVMELLEGGHIEFTTLT
jgi:hypothetical protein